MPAINPRKRKTAPSDMQKDRETKKQLIKGGWDELPHNIGTLSSGIGQVSGGLQDAGDSVAISTGRQTRKRNRVAAKTESEPENEAITDLPMGEVPSHKDVHSNMPKSASKGRGKSKMTLPVLPQSSGQMDLDSATEEFERDSKEQLKQDVKVELIDAEKSPQVESKKPKRKRSPRTMKVEATADTNKKEEDLDETAEMPAKKARKAKANPYGLTPGTSPFPDFSMPTAEACKQVEDALSEAHGKVEAPKQIPAPSLEVTGCGEVPSVLDALIRTRLSASTTTQNAGYAFTGLVARYGVRKEGIGAGSVDWNKVRESDVLDIETAIKKGGLARTKSISIKKILEMVHNINITRREAFINEKSGGDVSHIIGAQNMQQGQKDMEISTVNQGVLSLDFMHGLTADEAMSEFVKFPGIGVKTASCVILFCLQRPSFAVDTHVWRFCKWLKWVPAGATRDRTFSHCEVMIPNEMKYSLHQLFIRHGKTCGRCRAITGESSEGWEDTLCPLEHLVERTGKKKALLEHVKPKGTKGQRDSEVDSEELDLGDDGFANSEDEDN